MTSHHPWRQQPFARTNGHHATTLTAHQQPQHHQKDEIPKEHNKLQSAIHTRDAYNGTLIDHF